MAHGMNVLINLADGVNPSGYVIVKVDAAEPIRRWGRLSAAAAPNLS